MPTLSTDIQAFLKENQNLKVSKTTVWRALKRFDMKFTNIISSDKLKSRKDVIERRIDFCQKMLKYSSDNRYEIIYLDESYVHKNQFRQKTWKFGENFNYFSKPSGKGQRIVMIDAISNVGWILNSFEAWIEERGFYWLSR